MVQIATASLPHVRAPLNYLAATGEKPVSYAYQPPPGIPWSTGKVEEHATIIHDLRPAASEFQLDDVGFQLLSLTEARSGISGTRRTSSASIIPSASTF